MAVVVTVPPRGKPVCKVAVMLEAGALDAGVLKENPPATA